ncbi:MAG: hypothetical protein FJW38_23770 [Acidobacteria bacterium]|nr:hypothetical protein [Acidobacteriota bacterium]
MRLLLLAASTLLAQESIPARAKPSDYKVSAVAGPHTIAADFLGHTIPAPESTFVTNDYIVIELAVFPAARSDYRFDSGKLTLRVNGKKPEMLPQAPGFVAAALKYPSWEQRPRIEATGGIGNAGVILGRDPAARFPGDRRAPMPPPGMPPKQPGGVEVEKREMLRPEEWVTKLAWEDRPVKGPSAGLLYFPFRGKLDKIKKLELLYADAVLVLR